VAGEVNGSDGDIDRSAGTSLIGRAE